MAPKAMQAMHAMKVVKAMKGVKAMKVVKAKQVAKAKNMGKAMNSATRETVQKVKGKVHKIKQRPAKATQEEDVQCDESVTMEEGHEEEEEAEEQAEAEEEGEEAEEEGDAQGKATPKQYYNFWKAVPFASPSVQKAVATVKNMSVRSGKTKKLAEMALAYATQKWDHKIFKSMESLEQERGQSKEEKALPKVIMRAKCGGEEHFKQAIVPLCFEPRKNICSHSMSVCVCVKHLWCIVHWLGLAGLVGWGHRGGGKP
jgi:hypothetical protein